MKLSVVMTNYNYGKFLPEALEAMCVQEVMPYQLIIVDDGSTDDSVDIIKDYAKRHDFIQPTYLPMNKGGTNALKVGMAQVKGDYIYSAASDDRVLPGFFKEAQDIFDNHSYAKMIFTDWKVIKGGLTFKTPALNEKGTVYLSGKEVAERISKIVWSPICSQTVILERNAFEEVGGYREGIHWNTDFFTHHNIAFRHGAVYIPKYLATVRTHTRQYGAIKNRTSDKEMESIQNMIKTLNTPEFNDIIGLWEIGRDKETFPLKLIGRESWINPKPKGVDEK